MTNKEGNRAGAENIGAIHAPDDLQNNCQKQLAKQLYDSRGNASTIFFSNEKEVHGDG